MTAVRTRRTETGYKAVSVWVSEPWIATPNNRSGVGAVNPAWPVRRIRVLPWEICSFVRFLRTICPAMARDERAEVSRCHSSRDADEGLKLVGQEAGAATRTGWCARQIPAYSGATRSRFSGV